jgi:hypothetical protein
VEGIVSSGFWLLASAFYTIICLNSQALQGDAVTEPNLSFFRRIALAFGNFFRILSDPDFAARVEKLKTGTTKSAGTAAAAPPRNFREAPPSAALQLLGLLQQEGRFIDFLQEDVTGYSDAEVGAAARVIHQGCCKVVSEHFQIVPVRPEPEGSRITLPDGFDASAIRLTGNVVGKPPFTGSLVHRGWRVEEIKLPRIADGHDTRILAAAEVEL